MSVLARAQGLLSHWWISYDEAEFDQWEQLVTSTVTFRSRSDSGRAANEAQLAGSAAGREEFLAWQKEHRLASPYPLRHQVTNFHLVGDEPADAETPVPFRSTLLVTKVGESGLVLMSSAIVSGSVRTEDGALRLDALEVVLDKTPSRQLRDVLRERGDDGHATG